VRTYDRDSYMGLPSAGSGFTGRYHHDNSRQRDEFDRDLARYLESHQERWDITALVEPLDLLGSKVGQADVRLRRLPTGTLSVTISFELPPAGTSGAG
jgi:hypothetical protein